MHRKKLLGGNHRAGSNEIISEALAGGAWNYPRSNMGLPPNVSPRQPLRDGAPLLQALSRIWLVLQQFFSGSAFSSSTG